jgi:uroporphyrinogen-III decarboxylase
MTKRDRFWRFAEFKELDHVPFWGDWLGPHETWKKQGLPMDDGVVDPMAWFSDFFGFDGIYSVSWGQFRVPVNIWLWPVSRGQVLEETDRYRIVRSGVGGITKQFKDPGGSLISTQWLEYPIKGRDDWYRVRDAHLAPKAPGRYPPEHIWEKMKQEWKDRDYVITIDGGGFYGYLRDLIGVESFSLMFYEDPELVHEMIDYLTQFFIDVLHRAIDEVDIDFAMFYEDMCYKTGPLISPQMFKDFILPGYKKITSFLSEHGVKLSWVDCDGNIEKLLPLWIEGGVTGFYPLEVAAGMDAGRLQEEYGKQILMWGNVDKRAVAKGRDAIDAEMRRLAPVVQRGGFVPLIDHGVPDDVSYENYLYYLEQRKKICGIT